MDQFSRPFPVTHSYFPESYHRSIMANYGVPPNMYPGGYYDQSNVHESMDIANMLGPNGLDRLNHILKMALDEKDPAFQASGQRAPLQDINMNTQQTGSKPPNYQYPQQSRLNLNCSVSFNNARADPYVAQVSKIKLRNMHCGGVVISKVPKTLGLGQPGEQQVFNKMPPMAFPSETASEDKARTSEKYRMVYSEQQRSLLEKVFTHEGPTLSPDRRAEVAKELGLTKGQVKVWLQNRRAKDRKRGILPESEGFKLQAEQASKADRLSPLISPGSYPPML